MKTELKKLNELQEFIHTYICENPHTRINNITWPLFLKYNRSFELPEISKEIQFLKKHGYIKRSGSRGFRWIAIIPF